MPSKHGFESTRTGPEVAPPRRRARAELGIGPVPPQRLGLPDFRVTWRLSVLATPSDNLPFMAGRRRELGEAAWEPIAEIGRIGAQIELEDARILIGLLPTAFRRLLVSHGLDDGKSRALTTKFRDAGRRSAPWRVYSQRVAGRPQDGADGNRINRWLLPPEHKFFATERDATLVEVKYYLQTLSMTAAPEVELPDLRSAFVWLLGHEVVPGNYLDPITLEPISFLEFFETPTSVTSGHLLPLDRGGRHVPANTFLQLKKMNDLQGNNTVEELLVMMDSIVARHKDRGTFPAIPLLTP